MVYDPRAGETPALLESPVFWRSVADSIPDTLLLVDEAGRILYANHAPAALGTESIVGTSVLDFVPAAARSELAESLSDIFQGAPARGRELQGTLAEGVSFWYSTHTAPLVHEGKVVAAIVVARDVTERRQAQMALMESEARFRTLVENAPEAIVVFDLDGNRFVDANRNACELFEMDLRTLLLRSPADVSPPVQPDGRNSANAARGYLAQAMDGAIPSFEWVHVTSSGKELSCEVRLVRLPSDRRLVRGSIIDRTERIRMDHQVAEWQKMDALGQLAAGIAHDFRNVLTVIGSNAELIEHAPNAPADVVADAHAIRHEARRGADLTSQLLTFARKQTLPREHINLNDVVQALTYALRRIIPARIQIVEELDVQPVMAHLHRSQAEQVVMNLVLNARDAIAECGTIRITTIRARSGIVQLVVRDDGVGMTDETRRRSLEPFYSTKAPGQGTGLGLSMVQSIVKGAGGRIAISSVLGEGTTVAITLPAEIQKLSTREP